MYIRTWAGRYGRIGQDRIVENTYDFNVGDKVVYNSLAYNVSGVVTGGWRNIHIKTDDGTGNFMVPERHLHRLKKIKEEDKIMHNFKVGDRVCYRFRGSDEKGTIDSVDDDDGFVVVKRDLEGVKMGFCIDSLHNLTKIETPKYKRVVLELPYTKILVDHEMLEDLNACKEARIAFVKEYGSSKVELSALKTHVGIKFQIGEYPGSWLAWLENEIKADKTDSDVEYILPKDCSFDKFYAVKMGEHDYHYVGHEANTANLISFQTMLVNTYYTSKISNRLLNIKDAIKAILYHFGERGSADVQIFEFNNILDVHDWYKNEVA